MKIRLAGEITTDSVVDGEGIRSVVWCQGCIHNCPGCHNPETHSFESGVLRDVSEVCDEIASLEFHKFCQSIGLNVWCYTGYKIEDLLKRSQKEMKLKEFLENIDVLVDSPFILELKSYDVPFRGSSNQRLINAKESILKNKVVIYKK